MTYPGLDDKMGAPIVSDQFVNIYRLRRASTRCHLFDSVYEPPLRFLAGAFVPEPVFQLLALSLQELVFGQLAGVELVSQRRHHLVP